MNGLSFQNFPIFEQNWLKFKKTLEKSGNFPQNLAQNWANWYMKWVTFLDKFGVPFVDFLDF